MYALHLPSRHVLMAGLFALMLAIVFVLAADLLSTLDLHLFSGSGAATDPRVATPPATWATNPMSPPTVLLTH
jgi:hypothetical protein